MAPAESKKGTAYGWHFMVLMSRQGKIRLSEFFSSYSDTEKRRIQRDRKSTRLNSSHVSQSRIPSSA